MEKVMYDPLTHKLYEMSFPSGLDPEVAMRLVRPPHFNQQYMEKRLIFLQFLNNFLLFF
jgi:hypothetical protein